MVSVTEEMGVAQVCLGEKDSTSTMDGTNIILSASYDE
jgi:hypothetical protein